MNPNFADKVQSTPYDPLKINADDINSLKYSVISKIDRDELDAEIAARKAADITLQNQIDGKLTSKATVNSVNDEANQRQLADNTLQNNINAKASTIDLQNEVTERKDSFAKLSSTFNNTVDKEALTNEALLRLSADTLLQTNINAKVSQTAFNTEVNLRIAGDYNIQTALNNFSTGIGSASPTDVPLSNIKTYNVSTAGTYTNFGGIVVTTGDTTSGLVQLTQTGSGSTWSKVITPIALGNYALKSYVNTTIDQVNTVTKDGINKIDKSQLIAGSYYQNFDGSIGTGSAYKRYPLLELKTGTTYTLSGVKSDILGGLYNAAGIRQNKLVEYTANTFTTTITFTTGSLNNYLGINPSSVENTAPNSIDNTVMLVEGTSTTYTPFIGKYVVKGSSIELPIPGVATSGDLSILSGKTVTNTASLDLLVDTYNVFNGSAFKNLGTNYVLNAVGDYVEFTSSLTGTAPVNGLGLMGTAKSSNNFTNIVGYFSSTQFAIRQNSGAYILWNIAGSATGFKKYKIEVVAGGWQLSIDGVPVSTQAKTDTLTINSVGNAYFNTNFIGKLKNLIIHTATQDYSNTDFSIGSTGVTIAVEKKFDNSLLGQSLENIYVSYNPTGYTPSDGNGVSGQGSFMVYVKYNKSSLFYAGYQVAHVLDISGMRADLWRIIKCDQFKYVDGAMVSQNLNLLTLGESECVFQENGKSDASGGFHGDELLSSVYFYINGVRLTSSDLSTTFLMKGCSTFSYEQVSQIIETDNATVTPSCGHKKVTTFKDGGYTTKNTLTWIRTPLVSIWYSGILCTANAWTGTYYSESLNYINQDTTTGFVAKVNEIGSKEMYSYNPTNKLSCYVTSTITKAKSGSVDNAKAYDDAGYLTVYETSSRTKYYRQLRNVTPAVGEVWESFQVVKAGMNS
jgi:hypothetical protein